MTQQSRAEIYQALDGFLDQWVPSTQGPYAPSGTVQGLYRSGKQLVRDAIDAAVDEAYQAGYKAAMAEMEETLTEGFNPEYKDAGRPTTLVIGMVELRQHLFDLMKGIIDGEWGPYDDDHYWALVDEEIATWLTSSS